MATATNPAAAVANAIATRREQLLELVRYRGGAALDAEDVLHAAIVRGLEHAGQLRDPTRAEAWLGRVVQNALRDELRRHRERVLTSDDLSAAAPDQDISSCDCVLEQVKQMRPAQAEILRRVVIDDLPVTRVAAELGITANTAMVRLHRARAALVERLRDHCGTTSVRACSDCGCDERGCCEGLTEPRLCAR